MPLQEAISCMLLDLLYQVLFPILDMIAFTHICKNSNSTFHNNNKGTLQTVVQDSCNSLVYMYVHSFEASMPLKYRNNYVHTRILTLYRLSKLHLLGV